MRLHYSMVSSKLNSKDFNLKKVPFKPFVKVKLAGLSYDDVFQEFCYEHSI